ncbi:MAG: hypothetical protein EAZ77_10370 [Nostocales cyanobacterium]|nr:MAG: hypothetical protein EAZ77_10370 [Nostocales cyanobacterium]
MRITSIVILCIVSTLILMPRMVDVKMNFHTLILNGMSETESFNLTIDEINNVSKDVYIPPNYGAPNSQHGSGTR